MTIKGGWPSLIAGILFILAAVCCAGDLIALVQR